MKQLLEAGVHFGHQTRRWNPKVKEFIFTERNGIYIIDLQKTVREIKRSYNFVKEIATEGGTLLFVGTKRQAQESILEEANRCGSYYVNQRWLGGMLTNFRTIRERVDRLETLLKMKEDGTYESLPKKEVIVLEREKGKLEKFFTGIREMKELPGAIFIVDLRKERIALAEAKKLGLPVIAIVDTNCDPDGIDFPIPGNDDAIRSVRLIASVMANAVVEGRQATLEGEDVVIPPPDASTAGDEGIEDNGSQGEADSSLPSDQVEGVPSEGVPSEDVPSSEKETEEGEKEIQDQTTQII